MPVSGDCCLYDAWENRTLPAEYETTEDGTTLVITGSAEGFEVFVNGESAGIQIVPDYRYDLSSLLQEGKNHLAIELATTLARDAASSGLMTLLMGGARTADTLTGITGEIYLD